MVALINCVVSSAPVKQRENRTSKPEKAPDIFVVVFYRGINKRIIKIVQEVRFMCEERKPDIRAFFSNMAGPEPLGRKVRLLLRNNFLKLKSMNNCCGHQGEPGC